MTKDFLLFIENIRGHFCSLINKEVNNFWRVNNLEELTKITNIKNVADYVKTTLGIPSFDFLKTKGKMLRPILGYLMMESFGITPHKFENYLILPEVLHNASLIIDDIEDNAWIRRNRPTLHIKYGLDIAINTANALYYLPFHLIRKSTLSNEEKAKVYDILIEAMNRMHLGQGLDILWHNNPTLSVTPEQYLQMVKLKTSSFFRAEVQLAAFFSKINKKIEKEAINFAENLGVIFQIIDDILDLTLGKKQFKKFGKTFAQDITEGKKTLIVIYALKKADSKDRNRLTKILQLHTSQEKILKEAVTILQKYNAFNYAKEFVYDLFKRNWNNFSKLLNSSKAKDYLFHFYKFILERQF